jgi:hypothetical protein
LAEQIPHSRFSHLVHFDQTLTSIEPAKKTKDGD